MDQPKKQWTKSNKQWTKCIQQWTNGDQQWTKHNKQWTEVRISNDKNELHNKEMISIMIYHSTCLERRIMCSSFFTLLEWNVMLHIKRVINGSQGIFVPL